MGKAKEYPYITVQYIIKKDLSINYVREGMEGGNFSFVNNCMGNFNLKISNLSVTEVCYLICGQIQKGSSLNNVNGC